MPEPPPGNDQRPRRSLDGETPLPGRDRYEELYRPSEGGHPRGEHPLLSPRPRHFEHSLQAPEQPDPDDAYGWLFRDSVRQQPAPRTGPEPGADAYPMWGESESTIGEHSTEETTVRPPLDPTPARLSDTLTPARRAEVTQTDPPGEPEPGGVPGRPEVLETHTSDTYFTDDVSERTRRRWPMILIGIAVGLVVALIVALVLTFVFWTGDEDAGAPAGESTSTEDRPESEPDEPAEDPDEPADQPWEGPVAPIAVAGATAECVADPAQDAAGDEVHYDPALAIDDDPSTAWRCDGDGADQEFVITVSEGTTVAEVGLVNGYTKVDPADGADRYAEYRRITGVTWTFADGTSVDQDLTDGEHEPQLMRFPPVETDSVTLTVRSSTDPGSTDPSRDAVLVPTVVLSSPQE